MNLGTPESAIISAIIFNALVIPLLSRSPCAASATGRSARPRCCAATC